MIIGAGAAGISAARTLSRFNVPSIVVDKAPCAGGLTNELACKGVRDCVKCDVCLAVDETAASLHDPLIKFAFGAKVEQLERDMGRYRVTLEAYPDAVDLARCDRCGRCVENCPASAIRLFHARDGNAVHIEHDLCSHDTDDCTACQDVCAKKAIDLEADVENWQVEADAVIVATGASPFDPNLDQRLGYGSVPGVVSSLDVERALNNAGRLPDPLGKGIHRIAFIQCVGSRDPRLQAQLCSKVCCKYAMKLAKQAQVVDKTINISFFFMDWRPTDRKDDLLAWAASNDKIAAIRSRPAEVVSGEDGRPMVRFAAPDDTSLSDSTFDLVVLSVGLRPNADNRALADMLGARLGPHGFFFGEGKMVSALESKGIFFTGACTGPKDVEESAMDGAAAAAKAVRYVEAVK